MYKPKLPPEPTPPTPVDEKITVAYEICNTTNRVCHWDGWGERERYEYDEDGKEVIKNIVRNMGMANRGQIIHLSDVIKHLPEDVKLEDVYFTASFDDDHLQLHVRYDKETDLYEQQMSKYQRDMKIWKVQKEQYDRDILRYEAELKKELDSIKK